MRWMSKDGRKFDKCGVKHWQRRIESELSMFIPVLTFILCFSQIISHHVTTRCASLRMPAEFVSKRDKLCKQLLIACRQYFASMLYYTTIHYL